MLLSDSLGWLTCCLPCTRSNHCRVLSCHEQISAPPKAGEADTPPGAQPGKTPPDANGSAESNGLVPFQGSTPAVTTLLEFVAWLVFTEVPASARSANWFKGRGGYLADQLIAVREASVRVQVIQVPNTHSMLGGIQICGDGRGLHCVRQVGHHIVSLRVLCRARCRTR